jgi:YfiH family protein
MKDFENFFGPQIKLHLSNINDGPLNFVGHEEFDCERRANRAAYLQKIKLTPEDTVVPQLLHGKEVCCVSKHNPVLEMVKGDAICTDKKNLALTIGFGDCPTVFLYDTIGEVISVIHAGWKPLARGIIESAINVMWLEYGSTPNNIKAYIGPGICKACFEVGEDVVNALSIDLPKQEKYFVDLQQEIYNRLRDKYVPGSNIRMSDECTKHTVYKSKKGDLVPRYHSFRREKSNPLKTNMAVMMMVDKNKHDK